MMPKGKYYEYQVKKAALDDDNASKIRWLKKMHGIYSGSGGKTLI